MRTKIRAAVVPVVIVLLTAVFAMPSAAQESLEQRFAKLEAAFRDQAATVQRHSSQLANLNTKVGSNDEKLNKLLEITEAMASRQLNASRESQIASANSTQVTPVSTRTPKSELPRSAYDTVRTNRGPYRYSGPGVVIVISGYRYYEDYPSSDDDWTDSAEDDYYYSGSYRTAACR